jgi:aspartokinase-like uncharacterized kinase
MIGPVVFKVGGSLFDWPDLPGCLSRLLSEHQAAGRRTVVLAGGGPAVDFVRMLDRTFELGDRAAHHLALRSLDLTAHVLAALVPGLDVVDELAALDPVWERRRIPILAPRRFLDEHDSRSPSPLPHTWDVTSDTIAARVAVCLGAWELVLLKSTSLPPDTDRREAARLGLVDPLFPEASRDLERVFSIDVRQKPWIPRPIVRDGDSIESLDGAPGPRTESGI